MRDLHAPRTQKHDAHKTGKHLGSSNLIADFIQFPGVCLETKTCLQGTELIQRVLLVKT